MKYDTCQFNRRPHSRRLQIFKHHIINIDYLNGFYSCSKTELIFTIIVLRLCFISLFNHKLFFLIFNLYDSFNYPMLSSTFLLQSSLFYLISEYDSSESQDVAIGLTAFQTLYTSDCSEDVPMGVRGRIVTPMPSRVRRSDFWFTSQIRSRRLVRFY